jgi:hypothetical protein
LLFYLAGDSFSRSNVPRRSTDPKHSFCGTYPGRVYDELNKARELRKVINARRTRLELAESRSATQDVNQIAVIEDDGSLVVPANPFDLATLDLGLTANGAGSYTLSRQTGTINQSLGTKFPLLDDDTRQVTFQSGFQFPFLGATYSSLFINSDGNITFTQGDSASTDRDLNRLNSGPPRIAPFFADLDPSAGQGGVYYNQLSDRFLITWNRIREFDSDSVSSFQVALFGDGSFEFTYGAVAAESGIVGWSGGAKAEHDVSHT